MYFRIRNAIATLLLGISLGAMAYIIVTAPDGDPWRKLIQDFQTLIGGIFAVFAAWWTVETMELTDRSSQRRHEQLMMIQSRPDALIVQRFMATLFPRIYEAFVKLNSIELPTSAIPEELRDTFRREMDQLEDIFGDVDDWPERPTWRECERLFGGELKKHSENLQVTARYALTAASAAKNFSTTETRSIPGGGFVEFPQSADQIAKRTERAISVIPYARAALSDLKNLVEQLQKLDKIYTLPD